MGVGDERSNRLFDLMRDRGRQLSNGRDAIGVGELDLCVAKLVRG